MPIYLHRSRAPITDNIARATAKMYAANSLLALLTAGDISGGVHDEHDGVQRPREFPDRGTQLVDSGGVSFLRGGVIVSPGNCGVGRRRRCLQHAIRPERPRVLMLRTQRLAFVLRRRVQCHQVEAVATLHAECEA